MSTATDTSTNTGNAQGTPLPLEQRSPIQKIVIGEHLEPGTNRVARITGYYNVEGRHMIWPWDKHYALAKRVFEAGEVGRALQAFGTSIRRSMKEI